MTICEDLERAIFVLSIGRRGTDNGAYLTCKIVGGVPRFNESLIKRRISDKEHEHDGSGLHHSPQSNEGGLWKCEALKE